MLGAGAAGALPFRQKLKHSAAESAAAPAAKRSKKHKAGASDAAAACPAPPPDAAEPLLDLGELIPATLVARPSATIRSPYVADVRLEDGSVALAHAPGMELGGVCVPGARLLLSRPAKAGTTKTAYAIQLVAADAPEAGREACWVGAYPLLGNRLVAAALKRGLLAEALGVHSAVRAEATHGAMRVDFQLTHGGGERTTLLEVKNVVCSDFPPLSTAPKPKGYDLVYGLPTAEGGYARAAIFPVGKRGQKLEDGTPVVSTRAIKHVRELAQLAAESGGSTKAAVLFVVNRADCHRVCLRRSSCAVFGREAVAAAAAGVAMHAFRVRWHKGAAYYDGVTPVDVGSA